MVYGYEVKERGDRKITAGRKITQLGSETVTPGAVLVNELPFCEWYLWCGRIRFATTRSSAIYS